MCIAKYVRGGVRSWQRWGSSRGIYSWISRGDLDNAGKQVAKTYLKGCHFGLVPISMTRSLWLTHTAPEKAAQVMERESLKLVPIR